jgi:hypothetical protein
VDEFSRKNERFFLESSIIFSKKELYRILNNRHGRKTVPAENQNLFNSKEDTQSVIPYPLPLQLTSQLKKMSNERSFFYL